MSNASYAPARVQEPSFVAALLKDMFRATPLGMVIAALRSTR